MIQTISDNLKASIDRQNPVYKKTIELYRRLWNGSSYVYDTVVDITDDYIDGSADRIKWKLDKDGFGLWTLDNTSLDFRNDRNQWKQGNPKGYFSGNYILNQTKIRIKIGAQLADDTFETIYIFSGYISNDPVFHPEEKTITVSLVSQMSVFDKFNAEQISTLAEDELLGEDSGTEFPTTNNGVGIIVIVKRGTTLEGATEIKPNTDYTVTNLNIKGTPATITLTSALSTGEKLYCSYRYWYTDKTIEWLIEQIMTLCGISSYQIDPVIFSTSIENTWLQTTQADWDAGTKTDVDITTSSGDVRLPYLAVFDDFSDGDFTNNPTWTVVSGAWEINTSKQLKCTADGIIYTNSSVAYGTWECGIAILFGSSIAHWHFMCGAIGGSSGYNLKITSLSVTLEKIDSGGSPTTLSSVATSSNLAGCIFRITRSAGNVFYVYRNGVLIIGPITDSTYTISNYKTLDTINTNPLAGGIIFDIFKILNNYVLDGDKTYWNTGNIITQVLDAGASLINYGLLNYSVTLPSGTTIQFQTYSSDTSDFSSGNDPQGWIAISETGQIMSAVKRYLKVKAILIANTAQTAAPILSNLTVYYYTSTTNLFLVNLTNFTCKTLLDLLAQMSNYEMGFTAADKFIFRQRQTTAPSVLDLRYDTNLEAVENYDEGIERVYNQVLAEFGSYRKESTASGDSEPNSITKYGTKKYTISHSQLLPAENVNMAYAVAPTILAYTKNPRKRATTKTKIIAHLELGDKVTVYYDQPTALRRWKWGDTDVVYGQAELEYYDDTVLSQRYLLWGTIMRVEGIELDVNDWRTTFDLVEVL